MTNLIQRLPAEPSTSASVGDEALFLAQAIANVARDLVRSVPAPRGAPFFGLDMDVRVPALLDEFCRHGIFRKYERVLIVGCGLGGAARWWALRFGCSVIGVDSRPRMALAAQMLSRRARLDRQTQFLASDDGLPFRDACLTHAWIGGDFALYADRLALVHETLRVLRPGGALSGVVDGSLPAAGVDRCLRCLREAGFIAVQCRQPPAAAAPHSLLTALRRLETIAERQPGTRLAQLVASMRMDIERTMPPLQLFGERPS